MRLSHALLATGLLTCVSLLGACGPPAGALGDQPVLSGRIEGWNRGGTFMLHAAAIMTVPTTMTQATAPIDADGNFSITLPSREAIAPYLIQQHVDSNQLLPNCPVDGLDIDPLDFATAGVTFFAISGAAKYTVTHTFGTGSTGSIYYVYLDRDLTETGDINCTIGTTTIAESIDVHFREGWNREVVETGGGTTRVTTGPLPEGTIWK